MENQYLERAKRLRTDPSVHYNCAQAVTMTFADACGIDEEKACQLGAHFGSGMKMGAGCGAITGGLMAIGMMGGEQPQYAAFMKAMRENHGGLVNCRDLLRKNAETGTPQKIHCDSMVYEAVENVVKVMGLEQGEGE